MWSQLGGTIRQAVASVIASPGHSTGVTIPDFVTRSGVDERFEGSGTRITSAPQSTLDEPVKDTILRDVRNVGLKLQYVLLPRSQHEAGAGLRNWDLWGPLFLCLGLAIVLWAQAFPDQRKLVFSLTFLTVWLGSGVITINALLLGGNVSIFQSVCVLGYCLCPLNLASLVCHLIPPSFAVVKIAILGIAVHWATRASVAFFSGFVPNDRKLLAVYPVWLFYVAIAWMILII